MLIRLKNKDTLLVDEFKFKCSIGKNHTKLKKKEGDLSTPKGNFLIKSLLYRADRERKIKTTIPKYKIQKNMGWCNDPKKKNYNSLIKISKNIRHEKMFRNDFKYDLLLVIDYNLKKKVPFKGSAIFLHLTKNYMPTAGCIAIKRNDMLVLLKLINKKSRILIS